MKIFAHLRIDFAVETTGFEKCGFDDDVDDAIGISSASSNSKKASSPSTLTGTMVSFGSFLMMVSLCWMGSAGRNRPGWAFVLVDSGFVSVFMFIGSLGAGFFALSKINNRHNFLNFMDTLKN